MNVKLTEAQKKTEVNCTASVVPIMHQVLLRENKFGRKQEHFWMIGLNDTGKILFLELLALGKHNRANVDMLDVMHLAVTKQTRRIIFIHNHPNGTLTASEADKDLTDQIVKAADILHIRVLDHIIITETSHFSFLDGGIMDIIRRRPTYTLLDKTDFERMDLKNEAEKITAVSDREISIVKKLIESGVDDEVIKKATGLRLLSIRKLRAEG